MVHPKLTKAKKFRRRSVAKIKQSINKLEKDKDNAKDIVPPPSNQMSNVTCNNLQYLVDDCILKVFEQQSLDLMDLCSLAETCQRFKAITEGLIGNQLSVRLGKSRDFKVTLGSYTHSTYNKHAIDRIFKNFGSHLSAVTISNDDGDQFKGKKPLNSELKDCWAFDKGLTYRKYCVTSVELTGDKFYREIFKLLPKLISRHTDLKAIYLHVVERYCHSRHVVERVIGNGDRFRKFVVECSARYSNSIVLEATDNTITTDFSTEFKSIFEREMKNGRATVQSIGSFKSSSFENLRFLLPFRDLRELCFQWCYMPDDLSLFDSMIQLRKLEIKWCEFIDASFVVGMISRLVNLEELIIVRSWHRSNRFFELDEEIFSEIVHIVNERPVVLTLKCQNKFDSKNFDNNYRKVKLYVPPPVRKSDCVN